VLAPLVLLLGGLLLRVALALQMPADAPVAAPLLWGLAADAGLALIVGFPPLRPKGRTTRWLVLGLSTVGWFAWLVWLLFQYFYFSEFGTRPDQIVLDYIFYTGEVTGNVWESYPVAPLFAGCGALAVGLTAFGAWRARRAPTRTPGWRLRGGQAALGLALVAVAVVRPPPIADRTGRELARNGFLSLAEAAVTGELDYASHYRTLPDGAALRLARERLRADPQFDGFRDDGVGRRVVPAGPPRDLNVVLVIAESLGREFTAEGGRDLTPEFDRIAAQGLLFTRTYATGTRTARALEGALASFPPIPGNAIVRLTRQRPIETLATVLGERGYRTAFAYGGSLGFDNMGDFLSSAGFQERIAKAGCDRPGAFVTSWGAADEHLFDRVLDELRRARAEKQPLFLTALTVSNHRPFLFPAGRVPGKQRTRDGAVRYADWALGRFFEQARAEGFDQDTLFAVIGDHGPRSYTREKLPSDAHRVPFLLWGAGILPGRDPALASTLDVAPTLLGVLGRPYEASFFGRDLRAAPEGFALFQDKRDLALVTADGIAAVGFNGADEFIPIDDADRRRPAQSFAPDDPREALGVALYQSAYELFTAGRLATPQARPSQASAPGSGIPGVDRPVGN
jgi:phosphoglycerol transferase MdoB-like AlkP superfamily enzyme